jgi:hypothetical protein
MKGYKIDMEMRPRSRWKQGYETIEHMVMRVKSRCGYELDLSHATELMRSVP